MTEAFLQYVWQHQLMCLDKLYTTDKEEISIIKIGTFNRNAGPDFLNAKIKIGNTIWAGDVEIHIKSSDWYVHQHHKNPVYNSVILHAVASFDKDVYSENGHKIPTLLIPILPQISYNYMTFSNIQECIKCGNQLTNIDTSRINMFIERLVAERFEQKALHIFEFYNATNHNWEETLYQQLARNFGSNTNSEAFEALAQSLPLHIIEKHKDNAFQIEALLFGQANVWSNNADEYETRLKQEYQFLQKKYSLTPISSTVWKFAKMRPRNFPTIRIAQFARLLFCKQHITSKILEIKTVETMRALFLCSADEYWETHFSFSKESPKHNTDIGRQSIDTILINTVIPFLFAYGKEHQNENIKERAYNFLMKLPPEKNAIISKWEQYGLQVTNALESQGLIQLYNNYCTEKNCFHCPIGHIILKLNPITKTY